MTTHKFYTVRGIPGEVKDDFKRALLSKNETAGKAITRLMKKYIKEAKSTAKLS